jgi:hypothetical protein
MIQPQNSEITENRLWTVVGVHGTARLTSNGGFQPREETVGSARPRTAHL